MDTLDCTQMIRKYKPSDLNVTMEIWAAATELAHDFLPKDFAKKVEADMRNIYMPHPDALTWVYEVDNVVVGFISMIGNEIGGLFVHPKNHSQGIGSTLVNHVRSQHDQLEVEVFEKNYIGRAFYDKYGFHLMKHFLHEESGEMVMRLTTGTAVEGYSES